MPLSVNDRFVFEEELENVHQVEVRLSYSVGLASGNHSTWKRAQTSIRSHRING